MKRAVRLLPVVALAPLLLAAAHAEAGTTAALSSYCTLGGVGAVHNVWQGLGVSPGATDEWEAPANWSLGIAPLTQPAADRNICIPAGGAPRVKAGEESHLRTLDLDGGARLRLDTGSKLFLYGDPTADEDSVVRAGAVLDVESATFGGIGKLHVLGTFILAHWGSAAKLTVRDCPASGPSYPGEEACGSATPVTGPKGQIEIADSGLLDVRGGGVNFSDQYQLLVRGLMRIEDGAYVAADHGTRLDLRPRLTAAGVGTLRLEGDAEYVEGFIEADTGIAAMSIIDNQGLITRDVTGTRSVVAAKYSQSGAGVVRVSSGTILFQDDNTVPALVSPGRTFGTGHCPYPPTPGCGAPTTSDNAQTAQLRLSPVDRGGARVVVRELTAPSSGSDIGMPFLVHATQHNATAASPTIITLRFDATILGGRNWTQVRILRQATTSSSYVVVPRCDAAGKPPAGSVACVDRRGLAASSRNVANTSGPPDVVMVVRTTGTSRWVAR